MPSAEVRCWPLARFYRRHVDLLEGREGGGTGRLRVAGFEGLIALSFCSLNPKPETRKVVVTSQPQSGSGVPFPLWKVTLNRKLKIGVRYSLWTPLRS